MSKTIVITGATGNVGKVLAEALLDKGHRVRAIGRTADRLAGLVARGAEPKAGDLADAAFLSQVFAGAEAAFLMIPPNPVVEDFRGYQRSIVQAYRTALESSGVPRAVTLSSIGAQHASGNGPIAGLHLLETELDRLAGLQVIHLRPGYFFENHLHSIGLIQSAGINGSTARGDVPVTMVATHDIATVAAEVLGQGTFTGHSVRYVSGPRDYTFTEATGILGAAIGKPQLPYVQFTEDDARQAMAGTMSKALIEDYLEMNRGLNEGIVAADQPRTAESTTPTTLESWANSVFAKAFGA